MPGAGAEAGLSVIQALSRVADQARAPRPVLATVSVFTREVVSPWIAESASVAGVTDSTGCRMSNRTGTLIGELFASGDVNTIVSRCVPAGRLAGLSVTTTLSGAPPAVLDRVTQDAVFVAVQLSVPLPVFMTCSVAVCWALEPTFAESCRLPGLTASNGWFTVRVTGMRAGLPPAPLAVTTIVSV